MKDKKEVLAVRIPNGSCPICGHKQFIVSDISHNLYLTNRDGEIVDYNEYSIVVLFLKYIMGYYHTLFSLFAPPKSIGLSHISLSIISSPLL